MKDLRPDFSWFSSFNSFARLCSRKSCFFRRLNEGMFRLWLCHSPPVSSDVVCFFKPMISWDMKACPTSTNTIGAYEKDIYLE